MCGELLERLHLDAHAVQRLGDDESGGGGLLLLLGRVLKTLLGVEIEVEHADLRELGGPLGRRHRLHRGDLLADAPGSLLEGGADRAEARGEPALEHRARLPARRWSTVRASATALPRLPPWAPRNSWM